MKSMKNAETTTTTTTADNTANTITPSTLGLTKFTLPSGEYQGIKVYAVSYLPARVGEDGRELQATFGGLLEQFVDPGTGEVRGTRGMRDAVALSFFGPTAEKWSAAVMPQLVDQKRDSVILGVREDAEDLTVIRTEDGSLKAVVASSRTFSGKVKVMVASPEVEFEVG